MALLSLGLSRFSGVVGVVRKWFIPKTGTGRWQFPGTAKRAVIGRLPGEHSCLSLVWAVLDRASRGWRGVKQSPATVRLLQRLRHDLFEPDPDEEVIEEEEDAVTPAA